MRLSYILPLALAALVSARDASLKSVQDAFNAANVRSLIFSYSKPPLLPLPPLLYQKIPADLSIAFNPKFLLGVSFPQTDGTTVKVRPGVQLSLKASANEPTLSIAGRADATGPGGPFVAVMVDPDAPTPQDPSISQIRHLVASDLDAATSLRGKSHQLTSATPAISSYIPPGPPAGSDAHRYIILLYNQPAGFKDQTVVTPGTSVIGFNASAFAAATGLGDPIAGNFFLVAPEA
ncbi:hypothetical protein H0H81_008037 [Sphagnurus paluster]|uniref:PEBP-like protein n=1 Tax=Sphagnurus paluster TaxID=117069 RepID=A0A9P7FX49_9AGAR|nr:hypothetical protein H0H81_008037 [Sphagnurus paluster]